MPQARKTSRKPARNRRDPQRTREAILEVAGKLLARDGPEGLSVSQVAQIAGVNRGTAYHHFQTREQLLTATMDWVSQRLCDEVFGGVDLNDPDAMQDPRDVTARLVNFAMENPEFGPAWLHRVINYDRFQEDPFWRLYLEHMQQFVKTDLAQPGIDAEVHSFSLLAGVFMWPMWARSHSRTSRQLKQLTERYRSEMLRQAFHGTMNPLAFPEIVATGTAARKNRVAAAV